MGQKKPPKDFNEITFVFWKDNSGSHLENILETDETIREPMKRVSH